MEMISRHGGKGRGVIGHTIPDRSIIIWVVNRHGSLSSLRVLVRASLGLDRISHHHACNSLPARAGHLAGTVLG
jgi:hypothetical protein